MSNAQDRFQEFAIDSESPEDDHGNVSPPPAVLSANPLGEAYPSQEGVHAPSSTSSRAVDAAQQPVVRSTPRVSSPSEIATAHELASSTPQRFGSPKSQPSYHASEQQGFLNVSAPPESGQSVSSYCLRTQVYSGDHNRQPVQRCGSDPGMVASREVVTPRGVSPCGPPPDRLSRRAERATTSRAATPRAAGTLQPELPVVPRRFKSPGSLRVTTPLIPGRGPIPRSNLPSTYVSEVHTPLTRSEPDPMRSPQSNGSFRPRDTAGTPEQGKDSPESVRQATPPINPHVKPTMPSPSALNTPRTTIKDDVGNLVRIEPSVVRQTVTREGRLAWVLVGAHRDGDVTYTTREVGAPPKQLSKRAQDIMAAKRRAVEDSAQKRHSANVKAAQRPRDHFSFPPQCFYSSQDSERYASQAATLQSQEWVQHSYDHLSCCCRIAMETSARDVRWQAEQLVRTLQPIQVGHHGDTTCGCVVYTHNRGDQLWQMLNDPHLLQEAFKRYLNMQPMQLANVGLHDITEVSVLSPSIRCVSETCDLPDGKSAKAARGVATLGGLWCSIEPLREDGRSAIKSDVKTPRRVIRVCGGQSLGLPLQEEGRTLNVHCYELLIFAHESTSPSAVNYGSEGLTLGQLLSPPMSSFPLTPRLLDDSGALKNYRRRLLRTKSQGAVMQNSEDDSFTFMSAEKPQPAKYLTITLVTLNSFQKHTVDLTLVILPYRERAADGGKVLAEIPRFSPYTVVKHRRLRGISLAFPTQSAFLSAYKALLWATECNIIDVTAPTSRGNPYANLRVSATPSPLMAWSTAMGQSGDAVDPHSSFHGNCLDYSVITRAIPPTDVGAEDSGTIPEPLKLDDFVIEEYVKLKGEDGHEVSMTSPEKSQQAARRRSSIFSTTLIEPGAAREDDTDEWSTVVGLTSFGLIRRAVSQKTSEVYDVRVVPRNRARMCPAFDEQTNTIKSTDVEADQLLQQDVEAAIMMEYVSCLPFQSRVFGVLVDEQRYYIFQEPWISALSLEQAANVAGSPARMAMDYNTAIKRITANSSVMSLKDFIYSLLRPKYAEPSEVVESRLQICHVLIAQLFLLITSIHGKGVLLGPCPPQRILIRVEYPHQEVSEDGRTEKHIITSRNLQIFIPDIGVNTFAWSYERQQCGVLEYLSPSYIFEHMLGEDARTESRAWTMQDDWWTFLCIAFEILSTDGTALLKPTRRAPGVTPTPLITKFFTPVEVLNIWKDILIGEEVEGTSIRDTIAMRVRRYVQRRVLDSIAPQVDGWIAAKGEEIDFFGTTALRGNRKKAVPAEGAESRLIGISLASTYLLSNRDLPSSEIEFTEESDGALPKPNVLQDMAWVFHYRTLFDSVVDIVFLGPVSTSCCVHGPSLKMFSHPFFTGTNLGDVFDGCYVLPPAASQFFKRSLTKAKVQSELLKYRTAAYSAPKHRVDHRLLVTGSAFNSGNCQPLLLLSARESHFDGDAADDSDELVTLGSGDGSIPSSPQKLQSAMLNQSRIRNLYNADELRTIAEIELEVRSALPSHAAVRDYSANREMENPSRRSPLHRGSAPATTTSNGHEFKDYKAVQPTANASTTDEIRTGSGKREESQDALNSPNAPSFGQKDRRPNANAQLPAALGGSDPTEMSSSCLTDYQQIERSLNRLVTPFQSNFSNIFLKQDSHGSPRGPHSVMATFADPLQSQQMDRMTIDRTERHTTGQNSPQSYSVVHAQEPIRSRGNHDGGDVVLVPSDDDLAVPLQPAAVPATLHSTGRTNLGTPQRPGLSQSARKLSSTVENRDNYMVF